MWSIFLPWLSLISIAIATSNLDSEQCPQTPACKCKWSGGKRVADCRNAGLTRIPRTLSSDVQSLKMDGNPLVKLPSDEFKKAGLLNLQKLSLRGCQLAEIENGAFSGMNVLLELDLGHNDFASVNSKMFDDNPYLGGVTFSHNPIKRLVAFQFPALRRLKRIDFSHCRINEVDRMAFRNLGSSVESIELNNNRLRSIAQEAFLPLHGLREVEVNDNPWICDCDLKSFRDWLISNNLYGKSTLCAEPAIHENKLWEDLQPSQFACKPTIFTPEDQLFGIVDQNVTLSCLIKGSPMPKARWVNNQGLVITSRLSRNLVIDEKVLDHGGFSRWYNLTVVSASQNDGGYYKCFAENSGGLVEQKVSLSFEDPSLVATLGGEHLSAVIIYGTIAASVLFIMIMILIIVYCICKRRRSKAKKRRKYAQNGASSVAQDMVPFGGGTDVTARTEYQGLLPPGLGDESHSLLLPMHTAHLMNFNHDHEMRDMRANSVPSNMTTPRPQSSSGGEGSYHSNTTVEKASPLPDHSQKMSTPIVAALYAPSPVPSTISSVLTNQSFQRQHPPYLCQTLGRVPVGAPSPGTASLHGIVGLPPVHHHYHTLGSGGRFQHQRPGYVTLPRRPKRVIREPIYDGIGPRTSADGSSTLPRKKKASAPPIMEGGGNASSTAQCDSIKEEELPKAAVSTPNILDLEDELEKSDTSDQTILEELSGYCEPFGAAVLPESSKTLPRRPSLQKNSNGYRPIPAPKPRQRLGPGQVRKKFQDECEDGSEV